MPVRPVVELRPYQSRNVAEILALLERRKSPLYEAPTGSGKTRTATAVIAHLLANTAWRIGFFVHRVELMRQASAALAEAGIAHGFVDRDRSPRADQRVHIASIDTVKARLKRKPWEVETWLDRLNLGVIDECHRAAAAGWADVAARLTRRLGLSASPYRLDGKPLDTAFDAEVRGPPIRDLIADGWLAPVECHAPDVTANLVNLRKLGGDYQQREMQRLMDTEELTREAVRAYARWSPGEPAVAFCTGIDHARHVALAFQAAGWRATSIDGTMGADERGAAVAGLARGDVQVLTSVDLVSEGFDLPAMACGIMLRPTLSTMIYVQQIGRLMRPHRDKAAAVLIDMVGNVRTHGMPDEIRHWSLKGGLARGMTQPTRRCARCGRIHRWDPVCPGCGARYGVTVAPAVVAATFGGLTLAQLRSLRPGELAAVGARLEPFEGARLEDALGLGEGWARDQRRRMQTMARRA